MSGEGYVPYETLADAGFAISDFQGETPGDLMEAYNAGYAQA